MLRAITTLLAALLIAVAPSARAQSSRPQFEVASIKPTKPGQTRNQIRTPANRFIGTGVPLEALLEYAYRTSEGRPLSADDIINAPEWATWATNDLFDVMAKAESDAQPISQYQMRRMMQSLLADRLQLKTHWIQVQRDGYRLIVAKGGPKLTMSEDQTEPQVDSSLKIPGNYDAGPARGVIMVRDTPLSLGIRKIFTGSAIPVSTLVGYLQSGISRPIIDETGITGLFDIRLEFVKQIGSLRSPESSPAASDTQGNSIFVALQQQLGLKLESARGPVEVLVIDSVSKPSEN